MYTAADLENAKMEGYQEGANSLQEVENQLQNFINKLDEKTKTINELTDKVNALQAEKQELQNTIANKDNEIENRDELLAEKDQQITSLNEQIISLNNEIIRLNKLLEAYKNYEGQTYTATFYVDDTAVDVKVVDGGTVLSQNLIPIKTGNYKYTFKGWSLDKETVIDLNSCTVNENLNLYAVFDKNYYSIKEYSQGHISTLFGISSTEEWESFAGLVGTGTTFEGITIELLKDLDFTGITNVMPVGYYNPSSNTNYYFSGIFKGNGHEISNITMKGWLAPGLFGQCKNATISDFVVDDIEIEDTLNLGIGILCTNLIDSQISNVFGGNCKITSDYTGETIEGGLVGYVSGESVIENCSVGISITKKS